MAEPPSHEVAYADLGAETAGQPVVVTHAAPLRSPAEVATDIFMQDLQERANTARIDAKAKAKSLERRESVVFGAMVVSGSIAVLLVVLGFILAAFSSVPFALVSEAVGLLSGGGSAIFRAIGREAKEQREVLRVTESEEARFLRAIGVASMIPDESERNRAIVDLAGRLTKGIEAGQDSTRLTT